MNRFLLSIPLLCSGAALPLYFEPNQGQAHPGVEFLSRGHGALSYLTDDGAVFTVGGSPVKMRLAGSKASKPEGMDRLPGISSYFRGQDKSKWRTGIPQFAKVRYRNVYPGIDLVFYGNQGNMEYDFLIAPAADPSSIHISYEGTTRLRLDPNGDLVLSSKSGDIRQRAPKVYQDVDGRRTEIAAAYKLDRRKTVGLTLAAYDHTRPLVVDPVLQYSTYFGGPGDDGGCNESRGEAVKIDAAGNIYFAMTLAIPQSDTNPFSSSPTPNPGPTEAAVIKFSPTQNAILFVAHVGADGNTNAATLAIDPAGEMFIAGETTSADFPLVNPIVSKYLVTTTYWGMPYVTKIAADGKTLMYSTYFGGQGGPDLILAIALDTTGNLYMTGNGASPGFPILNALYSSNFNAEGFLAKISPAGSLIFSTLYPGFGGPMALAVDSTGVYVAGEAYPANFPKINSIRNDNEILEPPHGGPVGAVKFALDGQSVFYSSMFGGTFGDVPYTGAVDSQGNFYLAGDTESPDFPVVNAVQNTLAGDQDGFIAILSPSGNSLLSATFLGGTAQDYISGIALDPAGNIYVVGSTLSTNFPVLNAATTSIPKSPSQANPYEGFLAAYSPLGQSLLYSTLIGGSQQDGAWAVAVDSTANVYVAGVTSSPDLPVTTNAYQHSFGGAWDAFLMVFGSISLSPAPSVTATPQVLSFTAPGNAAQPAQTVTLAAAPGAVFTTSVSTATGGNWLSATLVGSNQLSVAVNPATLAQGDYQGTILVSAGTGTPATISVVLHIPSPPAVLTSYSFTAAASPNSSIPGPLTVYGSGFVANASAKVYLNGTLSSGQPNYIYIEPELLTVVDSHTVQFYTGVGSPTPITIAVSVTNPGSLESNALPILLGAPSPQIVGIQNSAFASQPKGEMITITGTDFGSPVGMAAPANAGTPATQLGSTRVLFNGIAVPITFVSFSQINALAPFSLGSALTAKITVEYVGVASAPITVQIVPSMIGVFTANSTGTGQGTILNQDGTPNSASNPATRGSVVSVYATGLGVTNPLIADGSVPQTASAIPVLPVAATIGGQTATVTSSYAAPGMLGVFVANIQVPSSAAPGSAIPIALQGGTSLSQAGVTIAIQ
jgi:uncharacterized protein (TIGR03437 family)